MGKSAIIRAEEARLKAKANERIGAKKSDAVTHEARSSTAKAKGAPVASEAAKRQAAKGKERELQAAKIKEEAARHAR